MGQKLAEEEVRVMVIVAQVRLKVECGFPRMAASSKVHVETRKWREPWAEVKGPGSQKRMKAGEEEGSQLMEKVGEESHLMVKVGPREGCHLIEKVGAGEGSHLMERVE